MGAEGAPTGRAAEQVQRNEARAASNGVNRAPACDCRGWMEQTIIVVSAVYMSYTPGLISLGFACGTASEVLFDSRGEPLVRSQRSIR